MLYRLAEIRGPLLATLLALIALGWSATAGAQPFGRIVPVCFKVSDGAAPPTTPCTTLPTDYQERWLWVTVPAPPAGTVPWRLTIRQSRFDQVRVVFHYADGAREPRSASSGDFGAYWQIGGKLGFEPRPRPAPVTAVSIGFEHLAAHELLRIRLLPAADRAEDITALVVGAALALLGFAAAFNLGIGLGTRRRFVLWHAAWAACVFGWGLMWTQVALFLWPGLAGPTAVGLGMLLSSVAIAFAGRFFVTSLEPGMLPRPLGVVLTALATAVAVLGSIAGFGPRAWLPVIAGSFGFVVIAAASALVVAIAMALRAGSRAARDFALSWVVPIAAVVWTHLTDQGLTPDDDSGQLMVLAVCALQTVGLSLVVGHRLALVRRERDEAQAREAQFKALADTDPLTGLYNRRGFVSRIEAALATAQPVALILLDLDHFKAVNDGFGHDAGDRVLFAAAAALRALSGEAIVGRLGGEEFGVAVVNADSAALAGLAERLRRGIAGLRIAKGPSQVTASFGVAAAGTESFEALYRTADRALYRAKAQGRDRVVVAETRLSLAS